MAENVAGTAQARKYGYVFRNCEFPKMSGKRSCGLDRKPPMIGLNTVVSNKVIPVLKSMHVP